MGRVGRACSAPTAAAPSPSRPTGKTWRYAPRAPAAHAPTPRWVTRPRAPERSGAARAAPTQPKPGEALPSLARGLGRAADAARALTAGRAAPEHRTGPQKS